LWGKDENFCKMIFFKGKWGRAVSKFLGERVVLEKIIKIF